MTTLAHRDGTSFFNELVNWMGSAATEPDIRIEEQPGDLPES